MSMQTETPVIGALSPWFGSKRNLAPAIVEELGPHRSYWEPFCGSMAVLLAKPAVSAETVNDLHGDLINLARVLQDEVEGPRLYRRLRRTLMHETLFREAAEAYRENGQRPAGDAPDGDRAYHYFVYAWMGRNGVQGIQSYNQGYSVRYTKNGGHGSTRFTSCVQSIPAWRRRLRGVVVLNRDGFELLGKIEDAEGVAIYCDPPYLVKGAKYVHDFTPADHRRMAELLQRFQRTRVVVSYYDHPDLAELYPGWAKRTIEVTKSIANQGKRDEHGATKAIEVLLSNRRQRTLF